MRLLPASGRQGKHQTLCSFVRHQPEVSLTTRWSEVEAQISRRATFFLQDVSTLERATQEESQNQWILLNHLSKLIFLLSEVNNPFTPFTALSLFICLWFLRCDVVFYWFVLFYLSSFIFTALNLFIILYSLYSFISSCCDFACFTILNPFTLPAVACLSKHFANFFLICYLNKDHYYYYKPVIQQHLCFSHRRE